MFAPTASPSPVPTPSETPIPMKVTVNGEGIPAAAFEAELTRYLQAQAGSGDTTSPEQASQNVLDELIDSTLLAQGAAASGLIVDEATVQARMDNLAAQVGGAQALSAWESGHGYTEAEFRSALQREIAAAWMRDQIAASVPVNTGQVHVKQILLYNANDAQQALGYLESGWTFDDLAARYDPVAGGELGWFPRGYLPSASC